MEAAASPPTPAAFAERYSSWRDRPFDYDLFTAVLPEFADTALYPVPLVEQCGKRARFYITDDTCLYLDGADRAYARALMVAHLVTLAARRSLSAAEPSGAAGASSSSDFSRLSDNGVVTSASVGGVSVSMQPPQSSSGWEYWMNLTPYGTELLGFLSAHVPAGVIYEYGSPWRILR